ncbi:hypothetical protein DYH09_16110 [bacterium CPR1]|nr:hypothetical protein [bacterium CPR1]
MVILRLLIFLCLVSLVMTAQAQSPSPEPARPLSTKHREPLGTSTAQALGRDALDEAGQSSALRAEHRRDK